MCACICICIYIANWGRTAQLTVDNAILRQVDLGYVREVVHHTNKQKSSMLSASIPSYLQVPV